MLTIGPEKTTTPVPQGQTELPSDISTAHRMPKDTCSDRCQASAVTLEDDTDQTKEWITCELSLALAQGNLPEILRIREMMKTAQSTDKEIPPRCPVLVCADNLVASINAKIAQTLSSKQVPEPFRT